MSARKEMEEMNFEQLKKSLSEQVGKVEEVIEEPKNFYRHIFKFQVEDEFLEGLGIELTFEAPLEVFTKSVYAQAVFSLNGVVFDQLQDYATMVHEKLLTKIIGYAETQLMEFARHMIITFNPLRQDRDTIVRRYVNTQTEQFFDLQDSFFANRDAGMFRALEEKKQWEDKHQERMTERLLEEIINKNIEVEVNKALDKGDVQTLELLSKMTQKG